MRIRGACLALALALGACAPAVRAHPPSSAPAVEAWMADRLYLGRTIPGGGTVSDSAWTAFLAEVVTPRFPDGLTVLRGEGQWRDPAGVIVRESSFVLEIYHADAAAVDAALEEIAAEYKRRFRQKSVMRVRTPAQVEFHD
ncbi:DUF3574 domain-containing protein [Longimicrobium sp.]|uniref:DUF3574 domain-containing protein n=1 Tax=Longimicrobium sp. TaxID=2029185 RepID=UPI002E34DF7B|nr:DUF3574 domain-containing protein [Longimicrobium sp.]HEX6040369.1 DUF3574 domain-containing protein [Longimicrobium sp.]